MRQLLIDESFKLYEHLFTDFSYQYYQDKGELLKILEKDDIVICRSSLQVDRNFLTDHPVAAVATVSSGCDNLDTNFLEQHQIPWFHAPGSNAAAVADYICAVLAWLMQTQPWQGKTAAVVGYGKVGKQVHQRLKALGFQVKICDPLLQHQAGIDHHSLADLLNCQLICLHCNYHNSSPYPSHHLINHAVLESLSSDAILINAARGGVVDEAALLSSGKVKQYISDVFVDEPDINPQIIACSLLATPHIAGHSVEFKPRALRQILTEIRAWLHMPHPQYSTNVQPSSSITIDSLANWKQSVLDVYNPEQDFQILQSANNLAKSFKALRQAHSFRHEFNWKLK